MARSAYDNHFNDLDKQQYYLLVREVVMVGYVVSHLGKR